MVWMFEQRLREAGAEQAVFDEVHCMSHHGYKLSIITDNWFKLIRRLHVSTVSEGDFLHFEGGLDPGNTGRDVYADKGYTNAKREATLRERGLRPKTAHKDPPLGVLSMKEEGRNQRIAKTRARVKHVFGGMEHMKVLVLKTIGNPPEK